MGNVDFDDGTECKDCDSIERTYTIVTRNGKGNNGWRCAGCFMAKFGRKMEVSI